jgi:GNAT superfamily N-acetyltransferase
VKIIDMTDEHLPLAALCLEDWSEEAREAGPARRRWLERSRAKGLRVKLATTDEGEIAGMIQYLPIEHSFADGEALYFINCIWVHGHKRGRGNFQKRGMGKALLAAAEEDARAAGAKGIAAWGIRLPFWMKASWFKKRGYVAADRQGMAVLLWKRFADAAAPPRWFPKGRRLPDPVPGKVNVTAFVNGWCMAMNLGTERGKRAAAELGDKAVYREVDTSEREAVAEWGFSDELFVDGKAVRNGPPPSYGKLLKLLKRRARRL